MMPIPYPCLLADIGGTNARFALVESQSASLSATVRLSTGQHGDFAKTVEEALHLGGFARPRSLLLAVAGAVEGRGVVLTNAQSPDGLITLDGRHLAEQLGLQQGLLLNDFEALSLSLPFLKPDDMRSIGGGQAIPGAPQIVIGPGTGLGVGALIQHRGWLQSLPSEAGHAGIGPVTAEDFALWPLLERPSRGDAGLSGDDLLSGKGLTRLYRGFARLSGCFEANLDDNPAAITARALTGTDAFAMQTMERFFTLLGRFAGDIALTFGASGGVFIGGGIAPRFAAALQASSFRAQFEAKRLHALSMAKIPVWLITAPDPAFVGLAELARNPARFLLDYESRYWR